MSTVEKIKKTALAIIIPGIFATVIVVGLLPTPPGDSILQILFILTVFLLSIIGPLNYPLLWGSYNASLITIVTFVTFLIIPILLYLFWYVKNKTNIILGISTTVWVAFGGFSAFMGIAAGV
jgi:small-conductance mechanosensitive channel